MLDILVMIYFYVQGRVRNRDRVKVRVRFGSRDSITIYPGAIVAVACVGHSLSELISDLFRLHSFLRLRSTNSHLTQHTDSSESYSNRTHLMSHLFVRITKHSNNHSGHHDSSQLVSLGDHVSHHDSLQ